MVKPCQKIEIKPNWLLQFKLHIWFFIYIFDSNATHLQNDFFNTQYNIIKIIFWMKYIYLVLFIYQFSTPFQQNVLQKY